MRSRAASIGSWPHRLQGKAAATALVSLTYAVAAARMARRGVLAQQLTVAAIARDVGIPVHMVSDGSAIPKDPADTAATAEEHT